MNTLEVVSLLQNTVPITLRKLQLWDEYGLVTPRRSADGLRRRDYGEADILRAAVVADLRDQHIPVRLIMKAMPDAVSPTGYLIATVDLKFKDEYGCLQMVDLTLRHFADADRATIALSQRGWLQMAHLIRLTEFAKSVKPSVSERVNHCDNKPRTHGKR